MRNLSTVRNLGKMARLHVPKGEKVVQIRGSGFNAGGYDPRASDNVTPVPAAKMPQAPSGGSYLPAMKSGGVVPGVPHHGKSC